MKDLHTYIANFYSEPKSLQLESLMTLVEEQMNSLSTLLEEKGIVTTAPTEEFVLSLPEFRLSEKMWGKEGTRDREIIQTLLGKIIERGNTLTDKIIAINDFLDSPPMTDDVSEILTHIVLLDTLTNIMLHFNASAAGFTFEGFLAALLGGIQVPAGTAGIQDIIDNDKNPVSIKLLTGEGGAYVKGSYRDLVDHFIDPGGLKQDPESGHYVGQAGGEGKMTYIVALKSFREQDIEEKGILKGTEVIRFYQFDFTAVNFLESLADFAKNHLLLLLPNDLERPPDEEYITHDPTYQPFSVEDPNWWQGAANQKQPGSKAAYNYIIKYFDTDFAKELLRGTRLVPVPDEVVEKTSAKKPQVWLVNSSDEPVTVLKVPKSDSRLKKHGAKTYEGYLDYSTSVKMLQNALAKSPDDFWGLIARTAGYEGGAGETQFHITQEYYRGKFYDQDGFGYVGQINVGKKAITELAQKYADVLGTQIFEIFTRVKTLSDQINAYFVAGQKDEGLKAAATAREISVETREYTEKNK